MTAYRRDLTPGSTWFFTVNLADRRSRLLVEQIDHLHALWVMPATGFAGA